MMKRKLSAPVMFSNLTYENRADYLASLKETQTERLFIAMNRYYLFMEDRTEVLKELQEHLRYFEEHGSTHLDLGIHLVISRQRKAKA